jgi:hypothetical protein
VGLTAGLDAKAKRKNPTHLPEIEPRSSSPSLKFDSHTEERIQIEGIGEQGTEKIFRPQRVEVVVGLRLL